MNHKCLSCDHLIAEGQEEEKVPGKTKHGDRWRHADYEDCQAALRETHPMSNALRADRIRQREGHVANLPCLEDMEKWDR